MRLAVCYGLLLVLAWGPVPAHSEVRISNDGGGRIGDYLDKYQALRNSGEAVVIDGFCASACTLVLGSVPQDRICVTARARLGFHAAYDNSINKAGQKVAVPSHEATQFLYSSYPQQVQQWITRHGGMVSPSHMLYLQGRELSHIYRSCREHYQVRME